MRNRWTRLAFGTLILVGGAVAVAATVGGSTKRDVAEPRILPVTTITVEPVTRYNTHRTYTGILVAARSADMGLERGGEITTVHVDQGDRVETGDVLATLSTTGLQARRRELVAQRAAAQAVLEELNAGARPETIAAARAGVRNLESQVKLQQLTLQRRETLIRQRAVSKAEYDQATFGLQSAEALLDVAHQNLAELEAGPRIEKKQAQEAAVQQLDAAVAAVDTDLEDSQLIAPFPGTITGRLLDEGTVVAAGQVVLRLIEDTKLEAWFGLPVSPAGRLQPGTKLTVRVDHRELAATVKAVIPELDAATRTRRVVLSIQYDAANPVFPGEIARLDLETELQTEASFWLPTTALVRGNRGLWSCFAVVPNAASAGDSEAPSLIEKRDVKVVHTAGERALVRGMLQPGDVIIPDGTHRVVPGQAVRNRPEARDTSAHKSSI